MAARGVPFFWRLRPHTARQRYLALWLAIVMLISAMGYGAFSIARQRVIAYEWGFLEAIADDRVRSVRAWVADRSDEALRLSRNPIYVETVERLLAGRSPTTAWSYFRNDIDGLLARPHYESIGIFDATGKLRRTFGPPTVLESLSLPPLPAEGVAFRDLFVGTGAGREIRLVMFAPLRKGNRHIGTLSLVVHPIHEVSAFLDPWPSPEAAVEVYLFRRADDEIVFLTPLRFAIAPLQLPPARSLLAAQGVIDEGRIRGLDYQGEPSIGVSRAIPGTPWHLMAKLHEADAFVVIRDLALLALLLSVTLIGMAGAIAWSRWRRVEAQHRVDRLKGELERRSLRRRYDYLSRFANDVIILCDTTGRILEVNERTSELYGYTRDELLRMQVADLRTPETRGKLVDEWDTILRKESAILETEHQAKDGRRFPVEASWRVIPAEDRLYLQVIIRDVTERKQAEARIARLSRLYRALSETNETILRQRDERGLLASALQVATREAGFVAAWIMRRAPAGNYLETVEYQGVHEADFRALMTPDVTDLAKGQVTSARAMRAGHSVYVNEYQTQPASQKVHDWVVAHNLGASASFPLIIDGTTEAVLGVYSFDPHAFDDEVIALLQKMADNLAFAIHGARQAAALAESEERLARVFEATNDFYWDVRFDRRLVYVSPVLARTFGLPAHIFSTGEVPRMLAYAVHPDDLDRVTRDYYQHLHGEAPELVTEFRAYTAERRLVWLRSRGKIVERDAAGNPLRMAGIKTDITRERLTEEQLRLWSGVFSHSREMIVIIDHQGHIVAANHAFEESTGYSAAESIGRDSAFITNGSVTGNVRERAWETALKTGYWQGELQARRKSGEPFPIWTTLTLVRNAKGEVESLIFIASDLSERKVAEERINFLAYYDALTGLPNRKLFTERLDQAITDARAHGAFVGVFIIDMDQFKIVNDSLSPRIGDQVLKVLASRLAAQLEQKGVAAHSGGDEFMAFCANLPSAAVSMESAARALAILSEPVAVDGAEVRLTASIGVSVFPTDGEDAETLLRHADTALHYAKATGRNHFKFYFNDLNRRAQRRWELESALRRAADNGEFILLYQPQVDSSRMVPTGVEALIRWPRDGQLLSPSEFIPIAEETGAIVPIGDWVVHEACRQKIAWREKDGIGEILVAFNLSAVQYREKEVLKKIATFLSTARHPETIELELTESMIMHEAEESLGVLRDLKTCGIRLAIDDFGTGYSSLSYLRRFPLDRLKVDQSFVRELPRERAAASIVNAIITLAKTLQLEVLAEGVETREELQLLRERGCDQMQGFYFAQPMTADETARWWKRQVSAASTAQ